MLMKDGKMKKKHLTPKKKHLTPKKKTPDTEKKWVVRSSIFLRTVAKKNEWKIEEKKKKDKKNVMSLFTRSPFVDYPLLSFISFPFFSISHCVLYSQYCHPTFILSTSSPVHPSSFSLFSIYATHLLIFYLSFNSSNPIQKTSQPFPNFIKRNRFKQCKLITFFLLQSSCTLNLMKFYLWFW